MTARKDDTRSGAIGPAPQSLERQLLSSAHQVAPETFWTIAQMRGDDGYDRIELARTRGWHAIPSWGRDGWDLGSWPLVVISHRRTADGYELAYNVEGDITVYRYPTAELREAATDCLAFWHWKRENEPWVDGIETFEAAPARLRGRFSWDRLTANEVSS